MTFNLIIVELNYIIVIQKIKSLENETFCAVYLLILKFEILPYGSKSCISIVTSLTNVELI